MATVTNVLRIGTWNLHEAAPADAGPSAADAARQEIIELLIHHQLDIVALQEVDFHAPGRSRTLDAIAKSTPLRYTASSMLSESMFDPACGAVVAIASRFPLDNVVRRLFENPDLTGELDGAPIRMFDKGYVSAVLGVAGRIVSFISLHSFPFHLFGRDAEDPAFRHIWSALSADLATLTPAPLIVCGDFNTSRRALLSRDRKLRLSRAITRQPTYQDQTIDDMLFSRHFELVNVAVVDNFSDHRLCLAEVAVERAR